jgi:hypothetical protein
LVEPEDPLHVSKAHLDLFALAARSFESLSFGQCPGDIAGVLMKIAGNLSHRCVGRALHFEGADIAIVLCGSIAKRAAVDDCSSGAQQLSTRQI